MEAKSKKLLSKDKYMESLNLVFEGKHNYKLKFLKVIKHKEREFGANDSKFLSYLTEIIKLFNQVGMQLMN